MNYETDKIEVRGKAIASIYNAMGVFRPIFKAVLEKYRININEEEIWIPLDALLDQIEHVKNRLGESALEKMGRVIGKNLAVPEGMKTLDDAFEKINIVYHLNHRINGRIMYDSALGVMAGKIGSFSANRMGSNDCEIESKSPYPCALNKGIIEGYVKRFCRDKEYFVKIIDKEMNEEGYVEKCTFMVSLV
jgi:hypothetical protein